MTSDGSQKTAASTLQEVFLNGARRERLLVNVRLMDGSDVVGRSKSFDRFALLVELDGVDMLLFKHAIASICPSVD